MSLLSGLTPLNQDPSRRLPAWSCLIIAAMGWVLITSPLVAADVSSSAPAALSVVNRSVTQDQGAWVVDYRLRYTGKTGVILTPEEITVKAEGWVSNSRVISHALPRWSSLVVSRNPDSSAFSEVIAAPEEAHRCRERLVVSIWTENRGPLETGPRMAKSAQAATGETIVTELTEPATVLPLSLGPDAIMRIRLRFEHQHILYGDYDPLLGTRTISLTLGSACVHDVVPLDRERYLAQPKFHWAEPPEERRDARYAVSGPYSLHLEAHVPGHQYYRYLDRPVRYGTKMRLRFWYLIAAGTEGDCKVRVTQCKDTPIAWRMLNSGGFEQCLKTVGAGRRLSVSFKLSPRQRFWVSSLRLSVTPRSARCGSMTLVWNRSVPRGYVGREVSCRRRPVHCRGAASLSPGPKQSLVRRGCDNAPGADQQPGRTVPNTPAD